MNRRTSSRALVAGLAIVAALTMTACSSDDDNGSSTTSKTTTTTTAAQPATPPVPTVDELNAQLQKALDPAVPSSEKASMIQGAEADPELPNKLATAFTQSGATVVVTSVQDLGDTVQANANLTVNGQVNPVTVPFIAEDGKWKIEKSWACNALLNLQIQSPACA